MSIHAALIEKVRVCLIELDHRHPCQTVRFEDAREPNASQVRIVRDTGCDGKVQSDASCIYDARIDGPGVVDDSVMHVRFIVVPVMHECLRNWIVAVQTAVPETQMLVV